MTLYSCLYKVFEETDLEYLSEVEAVAMDMNASFNTLVSICLMRQ